MSQQSHNTNDARPKTPAAGGPPATPAPAHKTQSSPSPQAPTSGAGAGPGASSRPASSPPVSRPLPQWKVILHSDTVNAIPFVIETITTLTPLGKAEAHQRTIEAHDKGLSLLLTTHQERAELYLQQFSSRNLTVTIEPGV